MIARERVKEVLGEVCPYCSKYLICLKRDVYYESGCEDFELWEEPECWDCEECHLFKLGICGH